MSCQNLIALLLLPLASLQAAGNFPATRPADEFAVDRIYAKSKQQGLEGLPH